jgi:hypothetical protein
MKLLPIVAIALAVVAAAPRVLANDRAACLDAAAKGQTLRDAHKLLEAREQFRLCVATGCPAVVQTDCAGWLAEADKNIPTVVLSAKDSSGNDVFDVSVTIDGVSVATKLDGVALPMNPGPHTFRFQRGDATSGDHEVLVREGQKDMAVAVSLTAPSTVAHPPPGVTPPLGSVGASGGVPWHAIGWVVGGVGVVGLGVGAAFTAITLSKKSAGDCNAQGHCANYASVNDAKNAAPVAGAGLIAGGALVVAGAALLLFTHPNEGALAGSQSASVHALPMLGRDGGGLLLQGLW